ncbi:MULTISPECIES: SDR family oxidoreductase [unclassified Nocardioides]|uniref:SDR family oxidoreductase n=1 Tax=unclassified Nocardioides TaxID=2615069 RepID=UPI0006F2E057|nr:MULTISPECIES: SDR family oxidoreductase [unclassified Nocardioides]KQY54483.1 short-chain dehydrogenase [Nocardioides sp. Root140]KRF19559.1 short-chain dehydrogenase [Nocardioides sp. Soil796]
MTAPGRHLVTGAGSGIGAAVARILAGRGDELWLPARSAQRADDLSREFPQAHVFVADLADPASLEQSLTGLPDALDSVLHIAGVVELGPVAELEVDDLRAQLDVNLVAPMLLTKACLPALRAARGLVLVVNSSAGLTANAHWSAYAASKFGVRAFADALRAEEQGNGVRVTTVYPSRTATAMQQKVHEQEGAAYDASNWIDPQTAAGTIVHVLDLPGDATIPEVTIRPAPRQG